MASIMHMTPTMMAMRYGALVQEMSGVKAENETLRQQLKEVLAKEEARKEKLREAGRRSYARTRRPSMAVLPASPKPVELAELVALEEPVVELEPEVIEVAPAAAAQPYKSKRQALYTAKSLDDEIRLTSEIDAGTLKSPTVSVSWGRRSKHHPSHEAVQLVLKFLRANPRQSRQQVCTGTGLDYEAVKIILRNLDKQGIVTWE